MPEQIKEVENLLNKSVNLLDEVKIPKREVGGFARACVSGKYRD